MYYIEQDNKIIRVDNDYNRLRNTFKVQPEIAGLEIKETQEGYTIIDYELMTLEEAEVREKEKKHERISKLSVTKSDFFDATIKAFGLDDSDLLPIVANIIAQVPVDDTMKKIALNNFKNAKDFYRNHEIFNVIAGQPIVVNDDLTITITSEQFDRYFDKASQHDPDAYKELLPEVENNNEL